MIDISEEIKSEEKDLDLEVLNRVFTPLDFRARIEKLYQMYHPEDILFTSSFGADSAFLLSFVSSITPNQKVHFVNTTYNFPETIAYKESLIELYGIDLVEIFPPEKENKFTRDEEWWIEHPKMCCTINKIAPLREYINKHKIWISGVMGYQTAHRAHLRVFEKAGDILKFHPLIDIPEGDYLYHKSYNKIPEHPLTEQGYASIGCTHCTEPGEGREGRWKGKSNKECGLHVNYFYNEVI